MKKHPLECDVMTKYGVVRVVGKLAVEAKKGGVNLAYVKREVEAQMERRKKTRGDINHAEIVAWKATKAMAERYMVMMFTHGIPSVRSDEGVGLPHAHWMLMEMRFRLDVHDDPDFDIWKASRWLGFIQREIILAGWVTVQQERDFSRPLFKPETTGTPE